MTQPTSFFRFATAWWREHEGFLLRAGTILAILGASALVGLGASPDSRRTLLAIALFPSLALLFLFMRWPILGVVLGVIGGVTIRFYGPSGLNNAMLTIGLLLGLWLFELITKRQRFVMTSPGVTRSALALIIVPALALVVGLMPWYPTNHAPLGAQLGGLSLFILSVGAFLIVANRTMNIRWLKVLTWSFLIFASIHVLSWIVPAFNLIEDHLYYAQSRGSIFWAWLVSLAFSQALYNRELSRGIRLLLMTLVIMALYIVFVYQYDWKSGWIPAFVAVTAILCLRSWKVLVVVGLLSVIPALQLVERAIATDHYSYSTRLDAYAIVAEIAKVNLLLGLGPANYYWYTPLFPIRGYAVQFNSHSQYVDLVAQTGILGTLCFLWFFFAICRLGLRLRNIAPPGFAQAYVHGALGGIAATLVAGVLGDWIIPFFYNVGQWGFRTSVIAWLFMGGLVVIERIYGAATTETSAKISGKRDLINAPNAQPPGKSTAPLGVA